MKKLTALFVASTLALGAANFGTRRRYHHRAERQQADDDAS